MSKQRENTSCHRVAKMPKGYKSIRNANDENLECEDGTIEAMISMIPGNSVGTLNQGQSCNQEVQADKSSRLTKVESRLRQLSEQNRKQAIEIERLRGSNTGFEEGNADLRAIVEDLKKSLSSCTEEISQCIDQREQWRRSYEAEIHAKKEEARARNRSKAENRTARNDSQWSRLFLRANNRQECEAETLIQLQQRCAELEHHYQSLVHKYGERELVFQEHLKKAKSNMDELTAHCSNLAKQSGLRRTYVPIEDESQMIDLFKKLNVAVRHFCWNAWELKPENEEVCFSEFPLGRKSDVQFNTDDVWVLVACVWEWLIKGVFGENETKTETLDLWLQQDSATAVAKLELQVSELQCKFSHQPILLS